MQLFKGLRNDGKTWNSGRPWARPLGDSPGDWMPAIEGSLNPFTDGYHVYPLEDLVDNLCPVLYTAEAKGEVQEAKPVLSGYIARKARLLKRLDRWDHTSQVMFAVACAERLLPRYEERWPEDIQLRYAIKTARRWANGLATDEDMLIVSSAVIRSEVLCETRAARFDEIQMLKRIAQAVRLGCVPVPFENEWWLPNCLQAPVLCRQALWCVDGEHAAAAERDWQTETLAQLLGMPYIKKPAREVALA